jgi:hypothetical protein
MNELSETSSRTFSDMASRRDCANLAERSIYVDYDGRFRTIDGVTFRLHGNDLVVIRVQQQWLGRVRQPTDLEPGRSRYALSGWRPLCHDCAPATLPRIGSSRDAGNRSRKSGMTATERSCLGKADS